jgi:UDP:flavonoid glycosyltransferase YjiC (YdhE family)
MRVLFTLQPGWAHFNPLINIAKLLIKNGHTVAFITSKKFTHYIENQNFQCFSGGFDWEMSRAQEIFPELQYVTISEHGLLMAHIFLEKTALPMAKDVLETAKSWQADMVISDYTEFGGRIAAEVLGIPSVVVGYGVRFPISNLKRVFANALANLRMSFNLPPDPDLKSIYQHACLNFISPSWFQGVSELMDTDYFFTPQGFEGSNNDSVTSLLDKLPNYPIVHAGLGTVYNKDIDFNKKIIDAFCNQPINLIFATGHGTDISAYKRFERYENIRITSFISYKQLLPHCDAMICHAGFNTLMSAIFYEVPILLLPLTGDHPHLTQHSIASQFALTIEEALEPNSFGAKLINPNKVSKKSIKQAVNRLLTEDTFRHQIKRSKDELSNLLSCEDAIKIIENIGHKAI